LCSATAGAPVQGSDGKQVLADLTKLEEVSTGRSLRLVLRPLIDAFSGQTQLADPDWTVRQAAVVKMGNNGDPAALPALTESLAKEKDRWVRYALEEAIALIQLKSGTPPERVIAATRLGALGSSDGAERLREVAAASDSPLPL